MWPFQKRPAAIKANSSVRAGVRKSDRMIRIPAIDFFGPYSESPNKHFTIAWSDSDPKRGVGGFREKGEGTFVLLRDDEVIARGHVQRPNSGRIADNGTFLINDWMFGEKLRGTFYAFDARGELLIKKLFSANLHDNGISPGGQYGVCQCANSVTRDSSALAFFDLEKGTLLWQQQPKTGWATSYIFDDHRQTLTLCYRDGAAFRYSYSGAFLDGDVWERQKLQSATPVELSSMARSKLKARAGTLGQPEASELLELLNQALAKGLDVYPNEKANVYRAIGEIFEIMGATEKAILNYREALELNPKIGLKRRLTNLER